MVNIVCIFILNTKTNQFNYVLFRIYVKYNYEYDNIIY